MRSTTFITLSAVAAIATTLPALSQAQIVDTAQAG
jgi:hypothetical protein